MRIRLLCLLSVLFSSFLWVGHVSAAALNVSAGTTEVKVDDTFDVSIQVNTEGSGVNAVQATLLYPSDLLEVIKTNTDSSVFNFWLEGPTYSNESGRLTFTGGATNGFVGASLPILTIQFKVKATGTIDLVFSDGAVTASDGSGTNVLSSLNGITITGVAAEPVVSEPTQITREATVADLSPAMPVLDVPLYPNPENWYNTKSSFLVRWNLPSDVSGVATLLNKNPTSSPYISEGLFDNKLFSIPEDGIWYLHVRFRNNIGWGSVAHHRIAVDTIPPAYFDAVTLEGFPTDVPNPTISFSSGDQLSGLSNYFVRIDSESAITTTEESFTPSPLLPGSHAVTIAAADNAGNETLSVITLNILPIPSPTISPVRTDVYVGEGALSVGGTADQKTTLVVRLQRSTGEIVQEVSVAPDAQGTWIASFDYPLREGAYVVSVVASDDRGAMSLPVVTPEFHVSERPFLVFAGVEISQFLFFFFIIILLVLGYVAGWMVEKYMHGRRGMRVVLAQRDVTNAFADSLGEIKIILEKIGRKQTLGEAGTNEVRVFLKRIQSYLIRVEGYILDNIEDINK